MKPTDTAVEVRRHLSAPAQVVFTAFAEATLVAQWLRPSPDVKLTVLRFEFREGGAYRFAYDVPDGRRMIVGGTYLAIEQPKRIVFSWIIDPPDEHAGIESEVTVTIEPSGSGADLVVRHAKFGRADAEARHAEGWDGALELLAAQLASGEGPHGDR
jgi:uncharacterized protein YndB with AHSA1/START domain